MPPHTNSTLYRNLEPPNFIQRFLMILNSTDLWKPFSFNIPFCLSRKSPASPTKQISSPEVKEQAVAELVPECRSLLFHPGYCSFHFTTLFIS